MRMRGNGVRSTGTIEWYPLNYAQMQWEEVGQRDTRCDNKIPATTATNLASLLLSLSLSALTAQAGQTLSEGGRKQGKRGEGGNSYSARKVGACYRWKKVCARTVAGLQGKRWRRRRRRRRRRRDPARAEEGPTLIEGKEERGKSPGLSLPPPPPPPQVGISSLLFFLLLLLPILAWGHRSPRNAFRKKNWMCTASRGWVLLYYIMFS